MDAGAVVETTGAGDAFNGGLAVALSRGFAPREAVRFANAVAGISVTRPGPAPSMPRLDEGEALLASLAEDFAGGCRPCRRSPPIDRTSGESGKSVSGRGDRGGRRIIN